MNENQNNVKYYEDEIDLKELIMALWKRKKMIMAFILIAAIFAGSFSMFILLPVYETKLNIIISMPEVYHTKYGEYKLPITTNEQYVNLITSNDVLFNTIKYMGYDSSKISIEKLNKRIIVEKYEASVNTVRNSFTVTVSADNPEESLKLAQSLFKNYIEFMDVMTKERAVNYYSDYFNVELKAMQNLLDIERETLKKNEELLSKTPKIIDDARSNVEIRSPLNGNSDYVVPVDTINPNYIKVENDIVQSKQNIYGMESTMKKYSQYLDELDAEKHAIAKYYEAGRVEKLVSSVIGVVETSVYLPSPPVAPTQKTSPSNALNTVIGAVIGGMIGIMVALAKEYWFKEDKK